MPFSTRRRRARKPTFRIALTALAASGLAAAAPWVGALPASASKPRSPADTRLVRSHDNLPRLPRGTRKLAALAGDTTIRFDVALAPRDPAALSSFLTALETPRSGVYHRYVTPRQFASRFGPAADTIAAVRQWLTDRGLTVGRTARDGLLIPVKGTATQVDSAFAVAEHQFELPSGRIAYAPTTEPTVPSGLEPSVKAIVGLDDVVKPENHIARPRTTVTSVTDSAGHAVSHAHQAVLSSCTSAANTGGETVGDLEQAYSFDGAYGPGPLPNQDLGQGVSVGVYELEPFNMSDITGPVKPDKPVPFEACYGFGKLGEPPVNTPSVVGTASGSQSGEAALDIEMILGMAPEANLTVYQGPNSGAGPLNTYAAMVNAANPPEVISTSWGLCESQLGSGLIGSEATLFQQAEAQGETIMAASGDSGSEDCYFPPYSQNTALAVDDPASQPYVTAVGGTSLDVRGPPPSETVWNNGPNGGAGGGGVSTMWRMPAWQQGPGVGNFFTKATPCGFSGTGDGLGATSCREVADVSSAADPNNGAFAIFCSTCQSTGDGWGGIGGTSEAAPMWAAIVALADEGATQQPVGDIHSALYQSACLPLASSPGTSPFNDVQSGPPSNNDMLGNHDGDYPTTAGYDQATGLGSPDVGLLVPDLRSPPFGSCPAVNAMTPSSDKLMPTDTATISGTNLAGVSEVDFGPGNRATGLVATPSSVTVNVPPSPTGGPTTVHVVLKIGSTDTIGLDDPAALAFSYHGPKVTSVAPAELPPTGGNITISGSGFMNNGVVAGSTSVTLVGQGGATDVELGTCLSSPPPCAVTSDTTISAVVPDIGAVASYDVEVTNSNGTSQAVPADRFQTVSVPAVSGVSPATGTIRGDTPVTITGTGFTGTTAVDFGATPAESYTVKSDTSITAVSPSSPTTTSSDITVTTYGQTALRSHTVAADRFTWMLPPPGYWMVSSTGVVYAFGVPDKGPSGPLFAHPTVAMAPSPSGQGYWTVTTDGHVSAYNAPNKGGVTAKLNRPIVGMASTADGQGYWLVATDGGIFTFGDARFHGSTGGKALNKPIVGMASTPDGNGYWLVASDGGIFTFGDAKFYGSTGGRHLAKPIVGMTALSSGLGYWLVASDGGVFTFGQAKFHGSTGAMHLAQPIMGLVAPYADNGYWLVARDGGIFSFGVPYKGSEGSAHLTSPIVGSAGP
jgi:hypothetical protein